MAAEASPVRRPPRFVRVALPVLLVASAGTLLTAILMPPPRRFAPPTPPPVAQTDEPPRPAPTFAMTERSGARVTNADLLGKVWVASFVFTDCTQTCPQVTATMYRLQDELKLADTPGLRLVTFSMDPEVDTPAVMRKYAADPARPAHPDRWLFLTGQPDAARRLMRDGFRLAFEKNPDPNAPPGQRYNHGTYLFVVDRHGYIRGHFDGIQGPSDPTGERYDAGRRRLADTVRKLLAEEPA